MRHDWILFVLPLFDLRRRKPSAGHIKHEVGRVRPSSDTHAHAIVNDLPIDKAGAGPARHRIARHRTNGLKENISNFPVAVKEPRQDGPHTPLRLRRTTRQRRIVGLQEIDPGFGGIADRRRAANQNIRRGIKQCQ